MKTGKLLICWDNEYAGYGYKFEHSPKELNIIYPFSRHDELKQDVLSHCEVIGDLEKNPELADLFYDRIQPFSNGTEFMQWQEHNCHKCQKYECESRTEDEAGCKLAFNIDLAAGTDGKIPYSVALQIGFGDSKLYRKCKQIKEE